MLKIFVFGIFLCASFVGVAQTNTLNSGDWNDNSVWSTGAQPLAAATVNVNHPLNINPAGTGLSPTGIWTFNSNATDQPGGTAYTFNPNAGTNTITIASGATVTFEGGTAGTPNQFNSGTIDIYGTLILGYTDLNNSGNLNVNIKPGGTLIIIGDLINKNNSGTFTVDGALIVYGNFNNTTGSVTVGGTGSIDTTGTLTSTGGSTIFGTNNDCNTGPCSGTTLNCTFANAISPANKTICSGTTAGTLTANSTGTTPTYQWLSSTDNITYSNASGTSTNSTYITPTLTTTTWYKVRKTVSGCSSISAAHKVTVLSGGGWLGTTNNWGTASNWCSNSVPTSSTDVVISNASGIANMPTIASGTTANCRNLTIANTFPTSSVTLAAAADASLNIFGDFTNNGSFTDNTTSSAAGVKFVGTSAQTIAGSTANVFKNLTINNTSGATPAINVTTNNITVQSNLTMTAGNVNLNGYTLNLGTAAVSAGTLSYTAGRFYSGNIQRWFATAAVTVGTAGGLFPIGTTTDYRPIYFGNGGLSAGGTIKVNHTASTGSTAITPFTDNGGSVSIRSNSFWTVTTANGIGTGTHNVRTEGTGFGTVGDVSHLRISRVSSISPGTDGAHAGTTTNPQVNRTGLTTANLSNSFYWGSINPVLTPLPIDLLFFIGRYENGVNILKWRTAMETNFLKFEIERSSNGRDFYRIGEVYGLGGDTKEARDYSFIDENPLSEKNYYRLKSIDLDETFEYKKPVIMVSSDNFKTIVVFPNPTENHLINVLSNFEPSASDKILIIDNLGQTRGEYRPQSIESQISLALGNGTYLLRYISNDNVYTVRFVVK